MVEFTQIYATLRPGFIWVLAILMAGMVIGKLISTSSSLRLLTEQNALGIYLAWEILKLVLLIWVLASARSLFPLAQNFLSYILGILAAAGAI